MKIYEVKDSDLAEIRDPAQGKDSRFYSMVVRLEDYRALERRQEGLLKALPAQDRQIASYMREREGLMRHVEDLKNQIASERINNRGQNKQRIEFE